MVFLVSPGVCLHEGMGQGIYSAFESFLGCVLNSDREGNRHSLLRPDFHRQVCRWDLAGRTSCR